MRRQLLQTLRGTEKQQRRYGGNRTIIPIENQITKQTMNKGKWTVGNGQGGKGEGCGDDGGEE